MKTFLLKLFLFIIFLLILLALYRKIKYYYKYHTRQIPITNTLTYFFEPTPDNIATHSAKISTTQPSYTKIANKDSFFDTKEYTIKKNNNSFRIIVLGDSYTDGAYVSTKDTWPELLEKQLNNNIKDISMKYSKIEVINLGVYSYDLQYTVNRFITRGMKYNPDLVILFTHDEDMFQINEIFFPKIKEYKKMKKSNDSIYYPDWIYAHKYIHDTYSDSNILAFQRKNLDLLAQKYNGNLLIITPNTVDKHYLEMLNSLQDEYQKVFVFPQVTSYGLPELSFPDNHLNVKGHKQTSEDIYKIATTFLKTK